MAFDAILQRFMDYSPITVMVRALLERVLTTERLNACFEKAANQQYTRDLLFSSVFDLMSLVVLKTFPSINAAYKSKKVDVEVSIASVYNKLNGMETEVSSALVRDLSQELGALIKEMRAPCAPLLPGYRVKMLDGNCLAATQHRLSVLRDTNSGPLPGKSLVVYDPALDMAINVIPCEDGHAQERSLLNQVRATVEDNDVFVMDRNFCVLSHLAGIAEQGAYFVCRHHKNMVLHAVGEPREIGNTDTGVVYEQNVEVYGPEGQAYCWRALTLKLKNKTRDGEWELTILTNLPAPEVGGIKITEIYRNRWSIETVFQELESHFQSEIDTLGYPKAALFGFCIALIAYNILAVIKAALRSVHGEEKIENEVSAYYLSGEIARTHEGLGVIYAKDWEIFKTMTSEMFVQTLLDLAQKMDLSKYKKSKRGPKKPPRPRASAANQPHVSTARLLLQRRSSP
jgi:Transposase DDE domain